MQFHLIVTKVNIPLVHFSFFVGRGGGGGVGWGGRLFEAGRLLTFPTFRVGANSTGGRLFEVGRVIE